MPALPTDTREALLTVTDGTHSGHTHSKPSSTRLHARQSPSLFVLVQPPTLQSQPHPAQVLRGDMHRMCTVYVCNKWPYELWMREYEGEAVHPQVLHSTDRLQLFVHFLLLHELFSVDLVAFSWENCVPSQHGGYYLGCGQHFKVQTTTKSSEVMSDFSNEYQLD